MIKARRALYTLEFKQEAVRPMEPVQPRPICSIATSVLLHPTRHGTEMSPTFPTIEGWLFLAGVIDLFSRHVVGWSMQPQMHSSLVIGALEGHGSGAAPTRARSISFIVIGATSMPVISSVKCCRSAADRIDKSQEKPPGTTQPARQYSLHRK